MPKMSFMLTEKSYRYCYTFSILVYPVFKLFCAAIAYTKPNE